VHDKEGFEREQSNALMLLQEQYINQNVGIFRKLVSDWLPFNWSKSKNGDN